MALTLEQENDLLALLDDPSVTLNELPKVFKIEDEDLFLARQEMAEKAVTGKVMKAYFSEPATLEHHGIVQLTNHVSSDNQTLAVTPKAVSLFADHIAPVGMPLPWPSEIPPAGYLKCNGASFDKSKYPKLAQVYPSCILPDLRGEFIRGWDDDRGVDIGRGVLSWQGDTVGKHSHDVSFRGVLRSQSGAGTTLNAEQIGSARVYKTTEFGGAETRPRNIAFLYIVRAA